MAMMIPPGSRRAFAIGLGIRILLLLIATPAQQIGGAVPFLLSALRHPLAPWTAWLTAGGDPAAFTGGLPSLFVLGPAAAIGSLAGAASLGVGIVLLACEIAIYLCLARSGRSERRQEIADLYWLSPLGIYLVYWLGSTAVIAAALLVAGVLILERRRYYLAGALFGLAIADQPVLIVTLPIIMLFALSAWRLRARAADLWQGLAIAILVPTAIGIADAGYAAMVLGSAEVSQLFAYRIAAPATMIALLPLVLTGLYYLAWRPRLLDRDLLVTFLALVLLAAVGFGGAGAAIFVLVPLLVHHAAYAERLGRALFLLISGILIVMLACFLPGGVISGLTVGEPLAAMLPGEAAAALRLVAETAVACAALVMAVQMVQRGILRSSTYLAAKRPFAVGIAGDSGVGKDTLSDAVAALFGQRTIATVSGDDYHNWDRNKPMWQALTHLNPKANDLASFERDVRHLADRRWVFARHYDHRTGRMTKPFRTPPGEILLVSGLHALWSPALTQLFDLRIFLDMDEDLRRFLKVRRDVHERGHPLERVLGSIERRAADTIAFIRPQLAAADIVFRLEPRKRDILKTPDDPRPVPLRLTVEGIPGITFTAVARVLVAICGVLALERPRADGGSVLTVEGDLTARDIALAARRLTTGFADYLRDEPEWHGGLLGVMQLVVIDRLEDARRRRGLNA